MLNEVTAKEEEGRGGVSLSAGDIIRVNTADQPDRCV